MKFKTGQRVRYIGRNGKSEQASYIGAEAVVAGPPYISSRLYETKWVNIKMDGPT